LDNVNFVLSVVCEAL